MTSSPEKSIYTYTDQYICMFFDNFRGNSISSWISIMAGKIGKSLILTICGLLFYDVLFYNEHYTCIANSGVTISTKY